MHGTVNIYLLTSNGETTYFFYSGVKKGKQGKFFHRGEAIGTNDKKGKESERELARSDNPNPTGVKHTLILPVGGGI